MLIYQAVFVMSQKVTQKSVISFVFFVLKMHLVVGVITSDAQPMSINTAHQVQTDQYCVSKTALYFIQKMLD